MNARRTIQLSAFALLLLAASVSWGAAFSISEWGARGLGMGNAVTAFGDDPSAIVFNPAGLAQQSGLGLQAGVTLIAPEFAINLRPPGAADEVRVDGVRQVFPVPAIFGSYRVHDRVAVGLGIYSSFGLGIEWPSSISVPGESTPRAWWGRAELEAADFKTMYIVPTAAVKLHERVLLGAGFNIIKSAVLFERAVTLSDNLDDDIKVRLSGDDWAFGANAGLLVKIIPSILNFGVTYRGGYSLSLSGDAAFAREGGGSIGEALRARLVDGPGGATLEMPHNFSFGVGVFPIERLKLGLAFELTTWSSYKELAITFEDLPESPGRAEALSSAAPKNWENTITLRVGGEYRVLPELPVRLGFVFDGSPVPAETVATELPDGNRYEFAMGVGYEHKGFTADLAYLFLFTGDNDAAAESPLGALADPGARDSVTYSASAHLWALSLGYHYDL